jgi:hypothetical protein
MKKKGKRTKGKKKSIKKRGKGNRKLKHKKIEKGG